MCIVRLAATPLLGPGFGDIEVRRITFVLFQFIGIFLILRLGVIRVFARFILRFLWSGFLRRCCGNLILLRALLRGGSFFRFCFDLLLSSGLLFRFFLFFRHFGFFYGLLLFRIRFSLILLPLLFFVGLLHCIHLYFTITLVSLVSFSSALWRIRFWSYHSALRICFCCCFWSCQRCFDGFVQRWSDFCPFPLPFPELVHTTEGSLPLANGVHLSSSRIITPLLQFRCLLPFCFAFGFPVVFQELLLVVNLSLFVASRGHRQGSHLLGPWPHEGL
mmetsp:Transcript_69753/g.110226  ORF Transcript_69753/g.110226 Transcript_69753/m.110226 type:complete len:275 (+) Transcript_69753:891-1715(+)